MSMSRVQFGWGSRIWHFPNAIKNAIIEGSNIGQDGWGCWIAILNAVADLGQCEW
jgi:hypothetical protein